VLTQWTVSYRFAFSDTDTAKWWEAPFFEPIVPKPGADSEADATPHGEGEIRGDAAE